ncbi:hypothetical protein [Streptomyces sp. NPDC058964]|uniref:hypothetical protein n=1 Tax=Streptomyces sp. NPDC058964 TaxID=3346681 RepID=UPI0036B57CCD
MEPSSSAGEPGCRRHECVHERPVGQAQQTTGGLQREPRVQGVLLRVPLHLVDQVLAQRRPVAGVREPVPGHGHGGRRHAHRAQFRPLDQPAPPHFSGLVRQACHGRQLGRSDPCRAPPGQARGPHVQHRHAAGPAPAARFAQHGTVADAQRQASAGSQPRGVVAQGTDGHRDCGGADVQGDRPRQVGNRLTGDPDVDEIREQPSLRGQQHVPAPQVTGGGPVHVDRHTPHPADRGALLLQGLQPAHP